MNESTNKLLKDDAEETLDASLTWSPVTRIEDKMLQLPVPETDESDTSASEILSGSDMSYVGASPAPSILALKKAKQSVRGTKNVVEINDDSIIDISHSFSDASDRRLLGESQTKTSSNIGPQKPLATLDDTHSLFSCTNNSLSTVARTKPAHETPSYRSSFNLEAKEMNTSNLKLNTSGFWRAPADTSSSDDELQISVDLTATNGSLPNIDSSEAGLVNRLQNSGNRFSKISTPNRSSFLSGNRVSEVSDNCDEDNLHNRRENGVPETDESLNATSHSHHSVEAAVRSKKASHIHAIDDSLAESPVIARNRKKTCAFIVSSDDDDDEGDSLVDHNDDASIDSFIDDRSRTDVNGSPPNNATSSFLSLKDVSMAVEDSISTAKPGGNYGMKETKTTDKSYQERRTSVMSSDHNSKIKKSGDRAYASNDASNLSIEEVQSLIYQKKKLAKNVKLSAFPDNGGRLKQQIQELEQSLSDLSMNSSIHESSKSASDRAEESIVVVPSSSEDESSDYATPMGKLTHVAESVNRYEPPKSPTLMKRLEDKNDETNEKLIDLKETLEKKKRLFQATNLRALDDGGDKLKKEINDIERELMMLELKAEATEIVRHGAYQQYEQKNIGKLNLVNVDASSTTADGARYTKPDLPQNVIDALYSADQNYGARNYGGKISDARERQIVRVTSDTLEAFSQIIRNMPDVENINPDSVQEPRGLRVDLMPHQKRALVWLLWRESQEPPGGILADDMGLGKTLTMLSLILRHKELISEGVIDDFAMETLRDEDQSDEEISSKGGSKWLPRPRKQQLRKTQGTLVVCPASLMGQWEREANDRISRGRLSVLVYHGPRRDTSIGFICKHDVVITTYQLAMKEAFGKGGCSVKEKKSDGIPKLSRSDQGCLYQIGWARIILDEGHCIRNHKSQTAQAMCMLKGGRRWILSGTPVQNKEMDMFSLIRFLRIAPFDEYICWKHQITNSNVQGMRRLTMIVKAILLRRTKDQVDKSSGEKLVKLPDKKTIVHELSLSQEEREIYDRIFRLSRNSLYEYMKTHEEKEREKESKTKDTLSVDVTLADKFRFTPTLGQKDLLDESVKTHHLLVLLLRLRQICCHPTLIKAIVTGAAEDEQDVDTSDKENVDASLLAQLHDMTLQEPNDRQEEVKQRPKAEPFSLDNPVFDPAHESSKIERVFKELVEIKKKGRTDKLGNPDPNGNREKAVIVSQWTSMLKILREHLLLNGVKNHIIDGTVPVKDRTAIVADFNDNPKGPKVLLLSLGAGGVGLNLVGANHLFLLDMHWNPQLEAQACDRIYRVGQTRPVFIHKFVVENTVEVKILELQKKKLQLAAEVLGGAKRSAGDNALSINDLAKIFDLQ